MAARTSDRSEQPKLLLKTYEFYMARYNALFPMVYAELKFYTGLMSVVVAGTIALTFRALAGLADTPHVWPGIVLALGGGLTWGLSRFGYQAFQNTYAAWLRAITTIAKLEADLGLLQPRKGAKVWPNETLLSPVFLVNEQDNALDSETFVLNMMTIGHGKTARGIFRAAAWIGGIMAAGGIAVATDAWRRLGG